MWDLPGPGIEPMSPALAGGFYVHCTREVPRIYILFQVLFHYGLLQDIEENNF